MMQRTHLELFEGSRNTVHFFRYWVCLCLPHLLLQQSQRERPWMELMEKGLVGKWMKMIAYQMGLPLPSFKLWTAPPKVWFKNDGFIWHLGGEGEQFPPRLPQEMFDCEMCAVLHFFPICLWKMFPVEHISYGSEPVSSKNFSSPGGKSSGLEPVRAAVAVSQLQSEFIQS